MASVSVTNIATLILADNPMRLSLIITNVSPDTVFIGQDATITSSTGIPIIQNGTFTEDSGGTKMYCGPIWGVTSGGTVDVRVWERNR